MVQIQVDREADKPLYAQIRDALLVAIECEALKPGEQFPTVAALAADLGVTCGTIRRAYEDLTKAGHVVCQVGRGTFVCDPEEKAARAAQPPAAPKPAAASPEMKTAARQLRTGIAKSLDSLLALQNRPGMIHFGGGIPGAKSIREGLLEEITQKALKTVPDLHRTSPDPAGLPALRSELARRFNERGIEVGPENILITGGSQQALTLMALSLLGSDRRIICETPCYTGVPGAFEACGHWVESVARDEEGPRPDRLERFSDGSPNLLYLCTQLHNPTGTDLSDRRLKELAEWGRRSQAIFIADEIFHDLRFESDPPASLFREVGPKSCVMTGSLSKSFMSSLRIGWLVTDEERVRNLAARKRAMDLGSPTLMQGIVLTLLQSGEYEDHLVRVRELYRSRRDAVIKALRMYMPEKVAWTTPAGGFNMWVELPAGYSSIALYFLAVERGVSFIPGPYMDLDHRYVNAFKICYADVEADRIREGIELLGSAVRDLVKSPPSDLGLGGLGDYI